MIYIPTLNAALNATSAACLILGGWAIKTGRVTLHRRFMTSALIVSAAFLVSYLLYHARAGSTRFTGIGPIRTVYFFILTTHTILAMIIVPLVFRTIRLAWRGDYVRHQKWARWTWPIWVYVSVTGVVVYWMLYRMGT